MSTEQLFNAAVNVIKSLPKNGPFNPSDDLKLKFYAYFKQATFGPNETKKPAFYDIVNKYKWDAWKKLGDMSKEKAMECYVDELKKVVETMSINDAVNDFYEILGPFYEFLPPESIATLQIPTHLLNGNNGDIVEENCESEIIKVGKKPSSKFLHKVISSNGNDSEDNNNDSEGEEFSDTYDRITENGDIPIASRNGIEFASNVKEARGGSDLNPSAMSTSNSYQNQNRASTSAFRSRNIRESRVPSSSSLANTSIGGNDGPNDGNGSNRADNSVGINEQLAYAVIRLQQSMDQVVNRLDTLESMLSQTRSSPPAKPNLWPFNAISPSFMIMVLVWPFVAQWIVHIIRQKRRK